MDKKWYNWPENYENIKEGTLNPWYTILRRLVFFIPAAIALILLLLSVYLGWGQREVEDLMKRL
jgi:hypothetical protein